MLTDTHCHLDFSEFDADRDAVIKAALALGIGQFLVPGVRLEFGDRLVALASRYPRQVAIALGVHPLFLHEVSAEQLVDLVRHSPVRVAALGETGLDGRSAKNYADQQMAFHAHLEAAQALGLPVIVHAVKALNDVLRIAREYKEVTLVLHGFSGSSEMARQAVNQGAYLGIGGVISRKNARKTHEALRAVPVDALLLETDSPDMAPHWCESYSRPYRNTPLSLPGILACLAEIRGEPREKLAAAIESNVKRVFPALRQ